MFPRQGHGEIIQGATFIKQQYLCQYSKFRHKKKIHWWCHHGLHRIQIILSWDKWHSSHAKRKEELSQNNQRKQMIPFYKWKLLINKGLQYGWGDWNVEIKNHWYVKSLSVMNFMERGYIGLESLGRNIFPKQCELNWL